jgi:hypothetical protein
MNWIRWRELVNFAPMLTLLKHAITWNTKTGTFKNRRMKKRRLLRNA